MAEDRKMIGLAEVFTEQQIATLFEAWVGPADDLERHQKLRAAVQPLMPVIDAKTGQENDLDYWTYALGYLFKQLDEE